MSSSPEDLSTLVNSLSDKGQDDLASELLVLQSIFGEDALKTWLPSNQVTASRPVAALRLELTTNLENVDSTDITAHVLISLDPETYPASTPPQLQLLNLYLGPYSVDPGLFGSILRTYISAEGVEFTPGTVCLFDGVQSALDRCSAWYTDQLGKSTAQEIIRHEERKSRQSDGFSIPPTNTSSSNLSSADAVVPIIEASSLPPGVVLHVAETITDRKSSFVGRACALAHPNQVPAILDFLVADRRVARAAHPIIHAWRCEVNGVQHQDNDDDGETAAGGRLAHLLQILDLNNVLVIVTRYFGGVHLGPDRFKHINQAARNALDVGGFLESRNSSSDRPARR